MQPLTLKDMPQWILLHSGISSHQVLIRHTHVAIHYRIAPKKKKKKANDCNIHNVEMAEDKAFEL